jgi:pilus assembly protein Flp/PilA
LWIANNFPGPCPSNSTLLDYAFFKAWRLYPSRPKFGAASKGATAVISITRFLRDESGATAIEYGLIAAGIAVAIIAVVQGLGTKLQSTFNSVKDNLN